MAYDSNNRSERLLQGRRFTTDNLTLSQEAFTDVFDLGAGEIFTDDGLIPTGSSQLAYSGSSQDGGIISGSVVNPSIGTDVAVLKYHYRKKLKPAGDGTREVYYFTTSDPSSPTDTVTSDQLLESDQQTNFISPKYIISADSVNTTESSTPGYKVVVYKSTQSSGVNVTEDAANPSTYVFDFKTGVLTWVSGTPTTSQYVYISVYQYIGRTLRSQIDDGSIGGNGVSSFNDLTDVPAGLVSGSAQTIANLPDGTVSGSVQIDINSTTGTLTTLGTVTSGDVTAILPSGVVSGSAQVSTSYTDLTNVPADIISGSSQVVANLPSGVVSGSSQTIAHLVGQDVVVRNLTAENYVVSSSVTHMTTSFSSGSTIFGDDITDTHQMTGSLFVSGSISFSEIDGGNF